MLEFERIRSRDTDYDIVRSMNRTAGKGNWFWAFQVGKKLYSWELGMQLYEDAYWLHLRKNISHVKKLVHGFNCFVNTRHDIEAGLDYKAQKKGRDAKPHYADIALRRCLVRLGVWFGGKEMVEIPGSELDPKNVAFHLPHLVASPDKNVKSWIDKNRLIVVAREMEDKYKLADVLVK